MGAGGDGLEDGENVQVVEGRRKIVRVLAKCVWAGSVSRKARLWYRYRRTPGRKMLDVGIEDGYDGGEEGEEGGVLLSASGICHLVCT